VTSARAVIGVPVYNAAGRGHLEPAVESLLRQTYPDVRFVFIDDCSSDGTQDVIASLGAGDARVVCERNPRRLGLIRNWRRAFQRAKELFPTAAYFAWGSDHDRWHSRWLETLVAELDAHPQAVMAYSRFVRIDERGQALTDPWPRSPRTSNPLLSSWSKIGAGNLVYGLYRAAFLERAGVFPLVYRPDVYLMMELSLYGDLRMVPETLWYRRERDDGTSRRRRAGARRTAPATAGAWWERITRVTGIGRVSRQHRYIFPERVPLYARLPSSVQHASLLFWRLAVLGRGRPYVGRRAGAQYAVRLFAMTGNEGEPRGRSTRALSPK
jgi:glycosyltransferase involved in cell wall biosynthesis